MDTLNDYLNATPAEQDAERNRRGWAPRSPELDGHHEATSTDGDAPVNCHYCTLPTPNGDQFHEICAYEVGPLHSCPDCGTEPCPACDPREQQ